jgi:hypothetical protein
VVRVASNVIYEGQPVDATCQGRDFVLERGNRYYYFAHDLSRRGSAHVATGGGGNGPRILKGLSARIQSVRWLNDDEEGQFTQGPDGALTLNCTGYDYGSDLVVRIAELKTAL